MYPRVSKWQLALGVLLASATLGPPAAATEQEQPGAATVFGPVNPLLARGAAELEAGHIEEGVRLTIEGLKYPSELRDIAAAHSNACAGYVMLKQWDNALDQCNAALELDTSNWRAYNNRASVYVERCQFALARRDLQAGLALAPQSPTLLESLRVLERNERILNRRTRRSVAS